MLKCKFKVVSSNTCAQCQMTNGDVGCCCILGSHVGKESKSTVCFNVYFYINFMLCPDLSMYKISSPLEVWVFFCFVLFFVFLFFFSNYKTIERG